MGLYDGTQDTTEQAKQTALQDAINKQTQTQYAADNGMNKTATTATNQMASGSTSSSSGTSGTSTSTTSPTGSTGTSSGTGASPVTSDGRINTANAPAPPPPAPAPAPVAAPVPPNPPNKPGPINGQEWVPTADGQGWLPPDQANSPAAWHPPAAAAAPAPAAPTAAAPGTPQNPVYPVGPTMTNPWGAFQFMNYAPGTIGDPNTVAYHNPLGPDRWSDTKITPATITQNPGTMNPELEAKVQAALEQAIAGGGGLDVERMKAAHLDDTMAMRDDALDASRDTMGAAGRLGGGFAAGADSDIRQAAMEQALGGYRDIAIQDAKARNENLYRGTELGNTFLNNQSGRKGADYAATLQGQTTQQNINNAAAANSRDNYIADLGGAGAALQASTSAGNAGIAAEASKYGNRLGLMGDLLSIMNNAYQGDQQTGLGYSQLFGNLLK